MAKRKYQCVASPLRKLRIRPSFWGKLTSVCRDDPEGLFFIRAVTLQAPEYPKAPPLLSAGCCLLATGPDGPRGDLSVLGSCCATDLCCGHKTRF